MATTRPGQQESGATCLKTVDSFNFCSQWTESVILLSIFVLVIQILFFLNIVRHFNQARLFSNPITNDVTSVVCSNYKRDWTMMMMHLIHIYLSVLAWSRAL